MAPPGRQAPGHGQHPVHRVAQPPARRQLADGHHGRLERVPVRERRTTRATRSSSSSWWAPGTARRCDRSTVVVTPAGGTPGPLRFARTGTRATRTRASRRTSSVTSSASRTSTTGRRSSTPRSPGSRRPIGVVDAPLDAAGNPVAPEVIAAEMRTAVTGAAAGRGAAARAVVTKYSLRQGAFSQRVAQAYETANAGSLQREDFGPGGYVIVNDPAGSMGNDIAARIPGRFDAAGNEAVAVEPFLYSEPQHHGRHDEHGSADLGAQPSGRGTAHPPLPRDRAPEPAGHLADGALVGGGEGGALVRYGRTGGRPPRDDESMVIEEDGTFEGRRTVGGARVGTFAGRLAAGRLRGAPRGRRVRRRPAGDVEVTTPLDGATETVEVAGHTARMGSNERPTGPWKPLVESLRALRRRRPRRGAARRHRARRHVTRGGAGPRRVGARRGRRGVGDAPRGPARCAGRGARPLAGGRPPRCRRGFGGRSRQLGDGRRGLASAAALRARPGARPGRLAPGVGVREDPRRVRRPRRARGACSSPSPARRLGQGPRPSTGPVAAATSDSGARSRSSRRRFTAGARRRPTGGRRGRAVARRRPGLRRARPRLGRRRSTPAAGSSA